MVLSPKFQPARVEGSVGKANDPPREASNPGISLALLRYSQEIDILPFACAFRASAFRAKGTA